MFPRSRRRKIACGCDETPTQPLMLRKDYGSFNDMYAEDDLFDNEGIFAENYITTEDDMFADEHKTARFHEGPKGRKEWKKWFEDQPQDMQDEWNLNTCVYGGTVTGQAPKSEESCAEKLNIKLARTYLNKKGFFLGKTAKQIVASLEDQMNDLLEEAEKADEKAKTYKSAWSNKDLAFLEKSKVIPSDLNEKLASSYEVIKQAEELVKKAVKQLKNTAKTKRKEARKLNKKSNLIMNLQADSDGSYMSASNIDQMLDMLSVLSQMITNNSSLEDWVESKIAHAHQNITDVANYMLYNRK